MQKPGFKIIGHRGACGLAPENTIESFEKAIALGARWVEFDVRLTQDGVPVVIHDSQMYRTTRLRGRVENTTSQALRAAGSKVSRVPFLREVLALLDAHGVGAYVEIKACPPAALPALLDQVGVARQDRIVSSFDRRLLEHARALSPEAHLQALFSRVPLFLPTWLPQVSPLEVGVDHASLSPGSTARILGWGYPVICYTVNDPARVQRLKQAGIRGVFTDFPDRFPVGD